MTNEVKKEQWEKTEQKMREIIIETDWNNIVLKKAEVSWSLEFKSILISLLETINKK